MSQESCNAMAAILSQEAPESGEKPPYLVQDAWQQSIEARGVVNTLLKRNKRRTFGKIEDKIIMISQYDINCRKVLNNYLSHLSMYTIYVIVCCIQLFLFQRNVDL